MKILNNIIITILSLPIGIYFGFRVFISCMINGNSETKIQVILGRAKNRVREFYDYFELY